MRRDRALRRYTESGLDYVWLAGGFVREDTAYGSTAMVEDATALDHAIAAFVVQHRRQLTGQEVQFLRGLLDLTQEALGEQLGKDAPTVARWEMSGKSIPVKADRALRRLYLEHLGLADRPETNEGNADMLIAKRDQDGRWTVSSA